MRHANVFRVAETPVFDKAHSRHHNKPDPYLQDCGWSEFRATEINKKNSVKIKQLQRYLLN